MQHTPEISPNKKTTMVMVVLILLPFLFTLLMWSVLPSGYKRCKNNMGNEHSISTWQPLQAGLKQVVVSFTNAKIQH